MSSDFDPRVDYYEILQVHPRAEPAVIRSAYRTILRDLQVHPDLGGSHEKAVLINDAYRVLTDAQLRRAYDRARKALLAAKESQENAVVGHTPEWQYVTCSACGRRNRIPRIPARGGAICGACGAQLFAKREQAVSAVSASAHGNTLRLSKELYTVLRTRGELELRQDTAPRGGKITCRRCRRIWTASTSCDTPHACPACGATDWKSFRLFKCRLCGEEFTSASLSRNPYLLFPKCPRCGQPHWHIGIESGPINSLLRLFAK